METYSIKKRTYLILSPIESDYEIDESYLVSRDDKKYVLTFVKDDFDYDLSGTKRFKLIRRDIKDLTHSSIEVPKLIDIDKRNNVYVKEYVEGKTILDEIIEKDLNEKIIETIFDYSFYARMFNKSLDFHPKNFVILENGKIKYKYYRVRNYDAKKNFEFTYLRYYLYSDELVNYLKKNNLPYDMKRKKEERRVNKETLLLACKYHR